MNEEFNKNKLIEEYNKLITQYNIKQLSPKYIVDLPKLPNYLREAISHWQIAKNMEDFRNLALIDIKDLIQSGNLEQIIERLGSDNMVGDITVSGDLINSLRTLKDEIASSLNTGIGKQIVSKYIEFISKLQAIVKRWAENKNKYESGKAISNLEEIPANSKILVQFNQNGHNFFVGLNDYLKYLQTKKLPRRLYNLTEDIKKEIEKNNLRLLSEEQAINLQDKILEKEEKSKIYYSKEDLEPKDQNFEENIKQTVISNYKKDLITKSLLEQEFSDLKTIQSKLNSEKRELSKTERPGSLPMLEMTRKYMEVRNKANEVAKKIELIHNKLIDTHTKFNKFLKDM